MTWEVSFPEPSEHILCHISRKSIEWTPHSLQGRRPHKASSCVASS